MVSKSKKSLRACVSEKSSSKKEIKFGCALEDLIREFDQ